jgi:hypothetical protein
MKFQFLFFMVVVFTGVSRVDGETLTYSISFIG